MIAPPRCPRADELVALLGVPATAVDKELRRHSSECPQCREELLRLSEGFAAMGDPGGERFGLSGATQQRIAARVMPEIFSASAAPAAPVVPVRVPSPAGAIGSAPALPVPPLPGRARLLGLGAAAALTVLPAMLGWLEGGYTLREPGRALGLGLLPLLILPVLVGPARQRGAALALTFGLAAALLLSTVAGMEVGFLAGAGCLLLAATGCLLPAAIVIPAATAAPADAVNRALRGVAIFSGGAALQRALCGVGGLAHALLFHLGPFVLAIALFTLLAHRLIPLRGPSASAA